MLSAVIAGDKLQMRNKVASIVSNLGCVVLQTASIESVVEMLFHGISLLALDTDWPWTEQVLADIAGSVRAPQIMVIGGPQRNGVVCKVVDNQLDEKEIHAAARECLIIELYSQTLAAAEPCVRRIEGKVEEYVGHAGRH